MSDCEDMPPLEDESPILAAAFQRPIHTMRETPMVNGGSSSRQKTDDDSDSEEGWDLIEEDCTEPESSLCLFCNKISESVILLLSHMKEMHAFDLQAFVVDKHEMDQIAYIKVNISESS